jgi:antitoxin component of MazEF toxin-antitoxin module
VKVIGKLGKNGNCAAVIIPRGQLRTLGWMRDEPLTIQVERGMLIVTSIRAEVDRNMARSAEAVVELEKAGAL